MNSHAKSPVKQAAPMRWYQQVIVAYVLANFIFLGFCKLTHFTIGKPTAFKIRREMTKQEVLDVAGRPQYIGADGTWGYRFSDGLWIYTDPLHVSFDENGQVVARRFPKGHHRHNERSDQFDQRRPLTTLNGSAGVWRYRESSL